MKKKLWIISILILFTAGILWAADSTYTTGFYVQQGGDRAVVASGGSLDVESGGEIDVESGGSLKLAGTAITATAAEVNKLAAIGAGDVVTTTNTKTLTNKTLSGPIFSIAATHVFNTLDDWVVSAADMLCTLLITDSGSGGANIVVNGGTAGTIKIVRNDGDGAVTIKESGGTGIEIAIAKTAVVMHNGTDYIRITADATH